jgi:hypothetical protein
MVLVAKFRTFKRFIKWYALKRFCLQTFFYYRVVFLCIRFCGSSWQHYMNDLVMILNVDNGLNDLFASENSAGGVLRLM